MPTRALDDNDAQLLGHIKSFKKVIYTNGLNWKFFNGNEKCFDILRSVFLSHSSLHLKQIRMCSGTKKK